MLMLKTLWRGWLFVAKKIGKVQSRIILTLLVLFLETSAIAPFIYALF